MRFILICLTFLFTSCTSPKSTFICGDHKCINKSEAKQYFEENLTIEVSIKSKMNNESRYDLVSLNLGDNDQKKKKSKKIKRIYKEKVKKKKKELKSKKKRTNKSVKKNDKLSIKNKEKIISNYKPVDVSTDICLKLDKCDIDTITKYLIKVSNEKDYPNISLKE